ncbi:MAG: hypothetical protein RIQ56_672 [Candidatus Parcubacteria bacterium]|jgi:hypothetical protein
MNSRYFIALVVIVVVLVPLSLMLLRVKSDSKVFSFFVATPRDAYLMRERIREVGPANAYAEFKAVQYSMPLTGMHFRAHAFGSALFKEIGTRGLLVCDDDISAGCLHQLFAEIFTEYGGGSGADISAFCSNQENQRACIHGAGHAFAMDHPRTKDGLLAALYECDRFKDWKERCEGGVFMEWNIENARHHDVAPVPGESSKAVEQCLSFKGSTRLVCMFWLPLVWVNRGIFTEEIEIRQSHIRENVEYALQECVSPAFSDTDRAACVEGLGYQFILLSGGNFDTLRKWCSSLSEDKELFSRCLSSAAIRAKELKMKNAETICISENQKVQDGCFERQASMSRLIAL